MWILFHLLARLVLTEKRNVNKDKMIVMCVEGKFHHCLSPLQIDFGKFFFHRVNKIFSP